MNVIDAAYITGHHYPGGMDALATRLGMSSAVLYNKLNPNCHGNHLTLDEAVHIQALTGDTRIMHAMCMMLGHTAIPLLPIADATTEEALAHTCAEFGEYLTSVSRSLKDGRISRHELRGMGNELLQMISQAVRLQAIMASMEAAGHPTIKAKR